MTLSARSRRELLVAKAVMIELEMKRMGNEYDQKRIVNLLLLCSDCMPGCISSNQMLLLWQSNTSPPRPEVRGQGK